MGAKSAEDDECTLWDIVAFSSRLVASQETNRRRHFRFSFFIRWCRSHGVQKCRAAIVSASLNTDLREEVLCRHVKIFEFTSARSAKRPARMAQSALIVMEKQPMDVLVVEEK